MADHNHEDTNMGDESTHINTNSSIDNDGQIDLAPNVLGEHTIEKEHANMKTVHLPESVIEGAEGNKIGESSDGVASAIQIESLAVNEISVVSMEDGNLRNHENENSHPTFHLSDVTPMDQDQDIMVNDSNHLDEAVVHPHCASSGKDTIAVECYQSPTEVFTDAPCNDIPSTPVSGTEGNLPNESNGSLGPVQDSSLGTVNGPQEALATGTSSLSPASTGTATGGKVSTKPKTLPQAGSALGVLSNYGNDGSDSWGSDDNEDEVEVVASIVNVGLPNVIQLPTKAAEYRAIQPSSDDCESDASESSDEESTSGSSSESLDDCISSNNVKKPPEAEADIDDEGQPADKEVPRTKGEATFDDLPPIADLQISVPEEEVIEMGTISSIVEQQVVIQAKQNFPPLNLDTVLFLEKGSRPLGMIFDVFGQVTEPFYSVRFNSADHVKEKRIETGMAVYCAPHTEHTNYVFVDELLKMKGSDASWRHNNETPSTFLDFSDDEAEQQARRQAKTSRAMNQSMATDCGQPQRKRVNSFERRMNERNLQKSALPPEPCHVLPIPPRVSNSQRGKRPKPINPFAIQSRPGRGTPSPGPVFPSPSAPPGPHPRQPQHGWEWDNAAVDQSMGFPSARHTSPLPPSYGRQRGRGVSFGGHGRGYGYGPVPAPPMSFTMGQGLPQHENPQTMRYGGPHSTSQPGGPMAMAYSMGHHMQPSVNNQSMVYQPNMMQGAQRPMFPVLLRPATFQAGPPHYDANPFVQNVPYGSPPQAYPQCYSSGPPPPPARGQSYNPMFSGVPMFNPGFPPPQIRPPPRSAMFPIGPPPPPRGV